MQRGFIVNRPIHAGTIYDRVVEFGGRFFRVQIKCVTRERAVKGGYNVMLLRNKKQVYPKDLVDVFAVYVMPEDSWYIFKNNGQTSIYIKSGHRDKKENWDLFYEEIQDHIQEA